MKKKLIILFVLLFSIFINAQYLSKVYVLSEGGFSSGSSMLSMLDIKSNVFNSSIFNPGNIGLYPDGLVLYENNIFLTEQGNYGSSGKIYKLDTLGNVINSAVVGKNPYSLTISNNKVYITNGPASNVSVLNLNDFSFIKNISVGVYPQEILSFNNKVFVANNSLYAGDSDSTVTVIDAFTDSVVYTITVKKDPSSLAISNDNYLLIGCPGDQDNGKIFKVNPNNFQIVDTFTIPTYGFGKDIAVDKNSSKIYFISYINDIVEYDIETGKSSQVLSSVYPNNYYYGYNFDYINKQHYVLDAKSFTVNGTISVLDSAKNLLQSFQTSIAPRRVLLKYNITPTNAADNFIVNNFELKQNYPNPFNPVTIISFNIPGVSEKRYNVSLKVYDILGNEISTLVNDNLYAGQYNVKFNAENFSSGIYLYTLSISDGKTNKRISKKMNLIK